MQKNIQSFSTQKHKHLLCCRNKNMQRKLLIFWFEHLVFHSKFKNKNSISFLCANYVSTLDRPLLDDQIFIEYQQKRGQLSLMCTLV